MPPKRGARQSRLQALAAAPEALVFYEAPHRVQESIDDMAAVLGAARELVIARELTKRFEQIVRLPLGEAGAWLRAADKHLRGEFVLVVAGAPPPEGLDPAAERVLALLLDELPVKSAARLAAAICGAPRNALYARALELKR